VLKCLSGRAFLSVQQLLLAAFYVIREKLNSFIHDSNVRGETVAIDIN